MSDAGRRPLPKRLEQDLKQQVRYKPNGRPGSATKSKPSVLRNAMNKNVEQAMFDEILGPLVNHNSGNRRPMSTSSPIRSPSGKGGVNSVGGLLRPGSASKKSSEESKDEMSFLKGAFYGKNEKDDATSVKFSESTKSSNKGDSSFTTSILSRLTSVEKENKDLRTQLASAATKLENIEHENKKLGLMLEDKDEEEYSRQKVLEKRAAGNEDNASHISSIHGDSQKVKLLEENRELREVNAELEDQLVEMEKFLADYGLVWVGSEGGGGKGGGSADAKDVQTEKQVYKLGGKDSEVLLSSAGDAAIRCNESESKELLESANVPEGVDYALFAKKVAELNDIIYSEPAQIKKEKFNDKQARLMQPSEYYDSVPVTFYIDGILVKRGPFRANGSAGYNSFVKDVIEGYFPTDFREEYPDGVILSLKDRHLERYNPGGSEASRNVVNAGGGGLARGGSNLLGSSVSMDKDMLLSRLPVSNVSAAGDVHEVRGSIQRMLSGADAKVASESSAKEANERARNARLARLGGKEGQIKYAQEREDDALPKTGISGPESKSSSRGGDEYGDEDGEDEELDKKDPPPSYQLSNLLSSPGYRGKKVADAVDKAEDAASRKADSGVILVSTPADSAAAAEETAVVKVRWLDGSTLSVMLYTDELVGDLFEHIKRHFYNASTDCPLFELRSGFPPKVLRGANTLQEAGFVPNGIAHAKEVR